MLPKNSSAWLTISPPPDRPACIGALRDRYQVSQAVLAAVLNTSLSTVRQWEVDEKRPSGPSVKLLDLLDRNALQALL